MRYLEIRQQKQQEKKLKEKQIKTKTMYKSIYKYIGFMVFFYHVLPYSSTFYQRQKSSVDGTGNKPMNGFSVS